jgi:hypothetical protein
MREITFSVEYLKDSNTGFKLIEENSTQIAIIRQVVEFVAAHLDK